MTRIAVIGAGAVGGWFGARLQAAGHHVTFVARGPHLARIRRDGITVSGGGVQLTIMPSSATDDVASIGNQDLAFIAVKLRDTETVLKELTKSVSPIPTVVSLQNGIDKDDLLRAYLPDSSVLGGACYISTQVVAPGVIVRDAPMERIVVGEYGDSTTDRATRVVELLETAGVSAATTTDIRRTIWEKFVFLVGLSGLTSLTRLGIGAIRSDDGCRGLLRTAMSEVVEVGRARGIDLPPAFVDDRMTLCDSLPAGMGSSMYHDLQAGRPLELGWLSGRVVQLGKEFDVATPINAVITHALSPSAAGRRQP